MKKLILLFTTVTLLLVSCTTLQEDIYYTSGEKYFAYQSVEDFEREYIEIDVKHFTNTSVPDSQITDLIKKIDTEAKSAHQEPALKARLFAFEGLLYNLQGNKSKATEAYKFGKAAQGSDIYIKVLGIELEKDNETKLKNIENLLLADDSNPLIYVEKAKILYSEKDYSNSVVAIDKALLNFSNTYFVEQYYQVKELIWNAYETQNSGITANNQLSPFRAVEIAASESTLLNFYTAGKKVKTNDLIKNLEKNGYFSSTNDSDNSEKTSKIFLKAESLNKQLTARFLWNIYIQNIEKPELKNRYSQMFTSNPNLKSPLPDVSPENKDFDAVLGCVENGIMDLENGVLFDPFKTVTEAEYLNYLNKIKK